MITRHQLKKAKEYANLSIKEGYSTEKDWENLTDEEFVKKAKYEADKGDFYTCQF